MKALFTTAVLAVLIVTGTTVKAQGWPEEHLGLPGDNLNLFAVMDLFQQSETLEGFEMALNSEESGINNLDLNRDNLVDYIMVTDYVDGNIHNIVLSVALNKKQRQDVAVFTVERFRNGSVEIQLVGDEALYGRNYIIEPNYADNGRTANPGYSGRPVRNVEVMVIYTSPWEIAAWPMIRYIYLPDYMAWHSPWYWGYWPSSWYAWNPWYYHYYYGYHYNWHNHYYARFRHWDHVRYHGYYDFYYAGIRHWSKDVHKNISKGYYKDTYSHPELQDEGKALYARVATQNNRTRVEASGGSRIRNSVPDNARVQSTAAVAERRNDISVASRSRSESGTFRSEANATGKSVTHIEAVETRRSAPVTGATTYSRSAATRSAAPAVASQGRSRTSGAAAPEVTGKTASRPAATGTTRSSSGSEVFTGAPANSRPSAEVNSGSRTRTEMAPRIAPVTQPAATNSGSSPSSRVSSRPINAGSSGNAGMASRPASSGNSSYGSNSGRSSSSVSTSRSSESIGESSSIRSRR
jgi:hypothetical protein